MYKLSSQERRSSFLLSLIFGVRMLGLFMILPVFSLYAEHFEGATPFLMGLALGMYGFSSGICQIFLGMLSDVWGRKVVITLALLVFIVGSLLCAHASSIQTLILGRFFQGLGASGSSILALLSDLTRPESRTKSMAIVGMMIGLSFMLSMILGPFLNGLIGLTGLFYLTGFLGAVGILILWVFVPAPLQSVFHSDQQFSFLTLRTALGDLNLWRLNLGVFVLHAILIGVFVALPSVLLSETNLTTKSQEILYFVTLISSFISVVPLILLAERKSHLKKISLLSILGLLVSITCFIVGSHSSLLMSVSLWIFFTGFIFLEASLPSWLSKVCPLKARGTCFGFYSSFQFLGAFFGGAVSGIFLANHSLSSVFIFVGVLALFWLGIKATIDPPSNKVTRMLSIPLLNEGNRHHLLSVLKGLPGVQEVELGMVDKTAYIRLNKQFENTFNLSSEEALRQWQRGH
jgi:MFS family permease